MDFCEIGADLWFHNRMIMKHIFQVAPLTPLTPIFLLRQASFGWARWGRCERWYLKSVNSLLSVMLLPPEIWRPDGDLHIFVLCVLFMHDSKKILPKIWKSRKYFVYLHQIFNNWWYVRKRISPQACHRPVRERTSWSIGTCSNWELESVRNSKCSPFWESVE